MEAIANANLQTQNIPDTAALFDTSLQGANSSRPTTSILSSVNRSPTKSQSSSNLSSGTDTAEIRSITALLVETIRRLLRTELRASSKNSNSERTLSPGELSSVEKERFVQDMQTQYTSPNRTLTFENQVGKDRYRSPSVADISNFRPSRSASNLTTFRFTELELDYYAKAVKHHSGDDSDTSNPVCFPDQNEQPR